MNETECFYSNILYSACRLAAKGISFVCALVYQRCVHSGCAIRLHVIYDSHDEESLVVAPVQSFAGRATLSCVRIVYFIGCTSSCG